MLNPRYWLYRQEVDISSTWYGEYWNVRSITYILNIQLDLPKIETFPTYEDAAMHFLNWRKETKNPFLLFIDWREIRKSMFNNLMGIDNGTGA